MTTTFDTMKKIDLHCHLDGSLSPETIRQLAANIGRELPDEQQLLPMLSVDHSCRDLAAYLKCFDLPLTFLVSEQNFRDAVRGVLRDAAREQVAYIEIRFSPLQSASCGLSFAQIIESALDGMKDGMQQYGIESNLILCGMRHLDVEENVAMLRQAREYLGEGVCAADMAGNEAAYPILTQRAFFEEARRLDLPFTIHAGECGSPQSIRDAVELGAGRIGHGIAAWRDPSLMELLRQRRIPLELCPVSNMQTRAAASAQEYPFRTFLEQGLCLTVNTDNRMVSDTCLCEEFAWLEQNCNLTLDEARMLTENALDGAFASDDQKQRIWRQLKL